MNPKIILSILDLIVCVAAFALAYHLFSWPGLAMLFLFNIHVSLEHRTKEL